MAIPRQRLWGHRLLMACPRLVIPCKHDATLISPDNKIYGKRKSRYRITDIVIFISRLYLTYPLWRWNSYQTPFTPKINFGLFFVCRCYPEDATSKNLADPQNSGMIDRSPALLSLSDEGLPAPSAWADQKYSQHSFYHFKGCFVLTQLCVKGNGVRFEEGVLRQERAFRERARFVCQVLPGYAAWPSVR